MLVINYNGNKPTTDYFKFSVQGNNNADVVRFCLEKKQGKNDLSGYKVYVQAKCEDDDFIDKVEITDNVNIVDNRLTADWTLLRKHTVNRQLQVSLSFEDEENEVVWQTRIVKVAISNGILADEEMINSYPTIIEVMQRKLDYVTKNYHDQKEKNFVISEPSRTYLSFKANCRVLMTENIKKKSKQVQAKYIDKKQGNKVTTINISAGQEFDFIQDIFGITNYPTITVAQINNAIHPEYQNWKIDGRKNPSVFYQVSKEELLLNRLHSSKINNYTRHPNNKSIAVIKLQFKFVKDFELVLHEKGARSWKGTMANTYLECIVFIFKELPNAYITARVKRF